MMKVCVCFAAVSGWLSLRHIEPVSLFRVAGYPSLRQQRLPTFRGRKPVPTVFANYSNRTVAHSVLTGTVSYIKFVKALGSDFTDVTPPEERNYLKVY